MKVHKNINDNIIAIAGTWDPVLLRHKALFKQLLSYGKKKGLNPYIIIFYPNPANLIHDKRYKDYFDLNARLELFKRLGINNVIVLEFDRGDLEMAAADFLNELFAAAGFTLNELWIGENQSFGTGPEGFFSIRRECANRHIKLRILKNSFLVNLDKESVYQNFKEGRFDLTASFTGYFPTYKLHWDLKINMYDGIYDARLRIHPFQKTREIALTATIMNSKLEAIERVDGYNWLVLLGKVSDGIRILL